MQLSLRSYFRLLNLLDVANSLSVHLGVVEAVEVPGHSKDFRRTQWRVLTVVMLCYLFFYTEQQNFSFAVKGIQPELGYPRGVRERVGAIRWFPCLTIFTISNRRTHSHPHSIPKSRRRDFVVIWACCLIEVSLRQSGPRPSRHLP